jgi:hypothetical protein
MNVPSNTIGQAVFIRTDSMDYSEVSFPFQTLDEMVRLCSESRAGLTLERVVIFSLQDGQPQALTLGFISASRGIRVGLLHPEHKP